MIQSERNLGYIVFQIVLVFVITYVVSGVLKGVFDVPRPCAFLDSCPESYSFPSSHAATGFGIATLLSIHFRKGWQRIVLFLAAGFIGYSRMFLGVHTIYDVLGGAVLGIVIGLIVYRLVNTK